MRYWPVASMICPDLVFKVAEGSTLVMRLPVITTVVLGEGFAGDRVDDCDVGDGEGLSVDARRGG